MSGPNQITITVKSTSGTWSDARFNVNNKAEKVLNDAVRQLGLDPSPTVPYRLTHNGRALALGEKLEDLGIRDGDVLIIQAGQPVDG